MKLGGIGGRRRRGNKGWDGWTSSPTRWTWVSVNSGRWWWTGRPGMLQFMGSQRIGHNWATELNKQWVTMRMPFISLHLITQAFYHLTASQKRWVQWYIFWETTFTEQIHNYLAVLGLSCSTWDLVSWPEIKPNTPALGSRGSSHWTTREVPH